MDDIAVVQIHASTSEIESDGAEIIFEFNSKQISVSVFPSHSGHASENHLITLLGEAVIGDDDERQEEILDEVLDVILGAGKPQFAQVAPLRASTPSNVDLHSLLYPETFNFRLQTIDGKTSIIPTAPDEALTDPKPTADYGTESEFEINTQLPQYTTKEIVVVESIMSSGTVTRVMVNGEEMLCKARRTGLNDQNLLRELVCLQKIHAVCSDDIRVPKLLGYVKHAEDGYIVGLLRHSVRSCLNGGLRDIYIPEISRERRQKWAVQIRETVEKLHGIGVFWCDGKIDNVVIDEKDDAWVIDFGGGWTEGWVDEKLADTFERDFQAVRNIVNFLNVGEKSTSGSPS
jgi:hypothetical protein